MDPETNHPPEEIPFAIVGRAPTAGREPIEIDAESSRLEIRVDDPSYDATSGALRFSLYVGYQLPYAFVSRTAYPLNAVVLSIEQPGSGAIGALRLMDPDQRAPSHPNYDSPDPLVDDPDGAFFAEHHALAIAALCSGRERLFVRASLQGLLSNLVEIDPEALPSRPAGIDPDALESAAESEEEE